MDAKDYDLQVERDIDGAPGNVFDAFLAVYDEPLPDWVLHSERDLRVGGVWDITFRPPGAEAFQEHRIFTAIDPPHRLEYSAAIEAAGRTFETAVVLLITEAGEHCQASLTQSGFPDEKTRDEFAAAWPDVLDLIPARIAG
ncbi:SRPBCC domain-containing protein [Promicromonospora sp. NPDC057138]|uniref:SRPBCC family protein n=1 Tax=Promicromonospora sp. NPDC057138 TaxID=3346031 RepID=UPI0036355D27